MSLFSIVLERYFCYKKKKVKKKQPDAVEGLSCSVETIPAVIEEPPKPQKALTELQTIRVLSNKMESVEQMAAYKTLLQLRKKQD